MKNFFFLLFAVCLSFQVSAANEVVFPVNEATGISITDDLTTVESAAIPVVNSEAAACWIIEYNACGGSVSTQYCNEGLHGTVGEWTGYIVGELCARAALSIDQE